jgi:protein-S-isoprenylcysteine O-methyltransferase Ste14
MENELKDSAGIHVPPPYVLFLFKAVKPEEIYLSQKFGEEYLNYSEKVRRWI